jgi:hypothetical protein
MALRIKFDGTNISFSAANDPLSDGSFVPLYTEAASTFLGTPNFVGFGFYAPAFTDNAVVNCYGMTVTTP